LEYKIDSFEKPNHRVCKHISLNLVKTESAEYEDHLEIACKSCNRNYKVTIGMG